MPTDRLFQEPLARPGEITINPWSYESLGVPLVSAGLGGGPVAAALPAANVAMFIPFQIPEAITITKLFWGLGAAAGNLDAAVYDEAGNVLVSTGSVVAAGATVQEVDVTDTAIARGSYYLCLVGSTVTTLTVLRAAPSVVTAQGFGLLEQAGVTLPLATNANPATFAKYTRAYIPYVGLQGYRTIGPT